MEKERLDPVYGYIDKKIKSLKSELAEQKKDSLAIEQSLATFMIISTANNISCHQDITRKVFDQISLVAAAAKNDVLHSDNPIGLAWDFYNQTMDYLKKEGLEIITPSY